MCGDYVMWWVLANTILQWVWICVVAYKGWGGMMELNALDFVNKYKDLLTDGVVVDPVLS